MNGQSGILPAGTQRNSYLALATNYYVGKVRSLFHFLERRNWKFLAAVVATCLIEPQNALYGAYLMQKGLRDKKITNLNPTKLSSEQQNRGPLILVHGDSSNSGLFNPMIDKITKADPFRPIFYVDLKSPDGIVSAANHLETMIGTVKDIIALYPPDSKPTISFVGHSSGGDILKPLVETMVENSLALPGAIIKIGSVLKSQEEAQTFSSQANVLEIVGTLDVFEGYHSHLANHKVVNSGHLGLLFDETVVTHVSHVLTNEHTSR